MIHVSWANIDFNCPFCEKKYTDDKDKYLDRLNENKCGYTKIKCDCGKRFGVAYDYGGLVSFKLNKPEGR